VLEVRPIGKLNMVDNKGSDEKILAVAQHDPRYSHIEDLKNVEPHVLKEIEQFFNIYKSLENKLTCTFGWSSKDDALNPLTLAGLSKTEVPTNLGSWCSVRRSSTLGFRRTLRGAFSRKLFNEEQERTVATTPRRTDDVC